MSMPLASCLIWKAGLGDETSFRLLVNQLIHNSWFGSMTQFGCNHNPQCEKCTQEQLDALNARFAKIREDHPVLSRYNGGDCPPFHREGVSHYCEICYAEPGQPHFYYCDWPIKNSQVAERANMIWQSGSGGSETENWFRAKKELFAERAAQLLIREAETAPMRGHSGTSGTKKNGE